MAGTSQAYVPRRKIVRIGQQLNKLLMRNREPFIECQDQDHTELRINFGYPKVLLFGGNGAVSSESSDELAALPVVFYFV